MVLLCTVSAFFSYNTDGFILLLYYVGITIAALLSKRDYFWIAFFYILSLEPAYLFWSSSDQAFIPQIRAVSGISLTIFDLYLVGMFVKALSKPRVNSSFHFSSGLRYTLFYLLLITLPISFIDLDSNALLRNTRFLFYYSLIFSINKLLKNPAEVMKIALLSLPALVLIVYDQLYTYLNGELWITQFNPWFKGFRLMNVFSGTVRAVSAGLELGYTGLFVALVLRMQKDNESLGKYGNYIIALVAFAFFLSITRNLIVFLGLFLITSTFFKPSTLFRYVNIGVIFVILILLAQSMGFLNATFIDDALARFDILTKLAAGNIEQTDTFQSRIDNEFESVYSAFMTSPLLGVGLTGIFNNTFNTDVGVINTLMLLGVIGTSMLFFFLFRTLSLLLTEIRNPKNPDRDLYIPVFASFIALIPLYLTLKDFFLVHPHKVFYLAIVLCFADKLYDKEKRRRKLLSLNKKKSRT